ncbi:LysR family transcriptional regulator [Janthinobacterium rivuli]|uniref:LysR family transcriptional regulator n=1 Tax=Janthinobacterium sp. FT68W TaxID=2654255 RepID=UPI00186B2336|nr:LysR family transcriptional regulator [Janthinobacterium sp. FT68W]
MRRFDLELLHTLATVAEARSLSAAAVRLSRSQSAVSEQIRKLEESCGLTLFLRGKNGTTLTPVGERLLGHARGILSLSDAAYLDMQGISLAGELRLAITDYFEPAGLATILKRLHDQYPALRLHVSVRKSVQIEQESGSGEFDIGLSMRIVGQPMIDSARRDSSYKCIPIRRERLAWVAAPSFALREPEPLPLIALPDTCSLQRYMLAKLRDSSVTHFVAHSTSGVGGLQSALSAGLGVACLNASAVPANVTTFRGRKELPIMPDVEFNLLVPQVFKTAFAAEAAELLAEQFRQGASQNSACNVR